MGVGVKTKNGQIRECAGRKTYSDHLAYFCHHLETDAQRGEVFYQVRLPPESEQNPPHIVWTSNQPEAVQQDRDRDGTRTVVHSRSGSATTKVILPNLLVSECCLQYISRWSQPLCECLQSRGAHYLLRLPLLSS